MIYDLGIIIPVYRPRESIGILTERIRELFSEKLTLRICIVDDSGRPETAAFLAGICRSPETAILVLDRNYGQQAATLCGLEHLDPCRYYATIDDDLEQPPEMLAALYAVLFTEGQEASCATACSPCFWACRKGFVSAAFGS